MSENWNENGAKSLWVAPEVVPEENVPSFGEAFIKSLVLAASWGAVALCLLLLGSLTWVQSLPFWVALPVFALPIYWAATHRQVLDRDFAGTVLMAVAVVALSFYAVSTQARSPKSSGQTTACRSNLKNIATACEMYSTDFEGHYPPSLALLTPKYLKKIPDCPSAFQQTYTGSYTSAQKPDAFTVYCAGHHHQVAGLGANYPLFNSERGLVDH